MEIQLNQEQKQSIEYLSSVVNAAKASVKDAEERLNLYVAGIVSAVPDREKIIIHADKLEIIQKTQ